MAALLINRCNEHFAQARTITDRTNGLNPVWNQYLRMDLKSPVMDVQVCIRDCGPKFLRRRRSSVRAVGPGTLCASVFLTPRACQGAAESSRKQVNKMLHTLIARGTIAVATFRRGMATPFVRVDLRRVGKQDGEPAGSITLRCQLQYPESLVLPPTEVSERMLDKFYNIRTPRLALVSVDRVRHLKALDPRPMFGRSALGHSFFVEIGVKGMCVPVMVWLSHALLPHTNRRIYCHQIKSKSVNRSGHCR